jgi:hypothetical protein
MKNKLKKNSVTYMYKKKTIILKATDNLAVQPARNYLICNPCPPQWGLGFG